MKSYLLFGIVFTLLNKKRCTVRELAEKYEVSTKTIRRHIANLEMAGISFQSISGKGGGIELYNTHPVERSFLTLEEKNALLYSLQCEPNFLDIALKNEIIDKLSLSANLQKNDIFDRITIAVDNSPWFQNSGGCKKLKTIKNYCEDNKIIEIEYQKENNIETREIEPYAIFYKESSYYLYAYCENKQDFRVFKISRIMSIKTTEKEYEKKEIDISTKPWNKAVSKTEVKFKVKKGTLPDVKEWLCDDIIEENQDEIKTKLAINQSSVNKILSFGDKITVLYPKELAKEIVEYCRRITMLYSY